MSRILIIFLILTAGVIVGPMLADHQGMVLMQFSGYRVKMSLVTFVIVELLLILLLAMGYVIFRQLFNSKSAFGGWLRSISPRKSAKKIELAQLALLEGDSKRAGKLLARSAKSASNPTLVYLQAAQAEIESQQFTIAREHLDSAAAICQEKQKLAFRLVQLRLQIRSRQDQLAKIAIEKLLEEKPRNPEVLRLADEFYYQTKDYQSIINILPAMYKSAAFTETQLDLFKNVAYLGRIKQLVDNQGVDSMLTWWHEQPKSIRHNPLYQNSVTAYQNSQ